MNSATTVALLSERDGTFKTGSIILQKNRIFSYGWNSQKTHPFQAGSNPFTNRPHAEIVALLSAQRRDDFRPGKATIVVVRSARSGRACSYPCNHCWEIMSYVGIRKILCYDCNDTSIMIDIRTR